jgi:hypothetical protein
MFLLSKFPYILIALLHPNSCIVVILLTYVNSITLKAKLKQPRWLRETWQYITESLTGFAKLKYNVIRAFFMCHVM